MFSLNVCAYAYMQVSTAVQMHSLYAAAQSPTFNYVCEWIWEKVNCSVKLGNGLFDVWALITWHFYYSTRREEGVGGVKTGGGGQKGWGYSSSWTHAYDGITSGIVRRGPVGDRVSCAASLSSLFIIKEKKRNFLGHIKLNNFQVIVNYAHLHATQRWGPTVLF